MATSFLLLILLCVIWGLYWSAVELNGAWGRWRRGLPILKSKYDAQVLAHVLAQERARRVKRKAAIYLEYEANPFRLDLEPTFYKEFKEYWDWKSVRADVINEWIANGGGCPGCGKPPGRRRTLHVDHISPRSIYPHLRYLKSNLQVLCSRCNQVKHDYDGDDWDEEILRREKNKKRLAQRRYAKNRKSRLSK